MPIRVLIVDDHAQNGGTPGYPSNPLLMVLS
jgi:hypothetical protein